MTSKGPLQLKKVIKKLRKKGYRAEVNNGRGKGSHRMFLCGPDFSRAIPGHGDNPEIPVWYLEIVIKELGLSKNFFWK